MVDTWFSYHFICPCSFTRNSLFEAVKPLRHEFDQFGFGRKNEEKNMQHNFFTFLKLPIRFIKKIIIQDEKRIEREGRLLVDAWFSYHFICPCSFSRNSLFEAVTGTHSQDLWVAGLGQDCTQQGLSFISVCT